MSLIGRISKFLYGREKKRMSKKRRVSVKKIASLKRKGAVRVKDSATLRMLPKKLKN